MGFGTWNMSLYRVSPLVTVLRELSKYELDLVGVQEVRWEGDGTAPVGEYTFVYGKGNENHELGTVSFLLYIRESHQQLRGQSLLVTGISYTLLRDCWFHIFVLYVHAPTEDNIDDVKGSFYEELEMCMLNPLNGMRQLC
jgi:hypothetical protein